VLEDLSFVEESWKGIAERIFDDHSDVAAAAFTAVRRFLPLVVWARVAGKRGGAHKN